jgi:hypothetical protein
MPPLSLFSPPRLPQTRAKHGQVTKANTDIYKQLELIATIVIKLIEAKWENDVCNLNKSHFNQTKQQCSLNTQEEHIFASLFGWCFTGQCHYQIKANNYFYQIDSKWGNETSTLNKNHLNTPTTTIILLGKWCKHKTGDLDVKHKD